ncbi:hypothetical protein KL905_002359 [Ogataea polymorpha]|nr:hypothetical protein KL937_001619 [Ogataea polymorpha]KAG7890081.1 hypothetical protein KL936_002755 [Ogataea polymorpha]KAG7893513.1 hypothetical protein KL908_002567 [Ogataea polymorpha]KAG7901135.1 hypothetical protein KL935_002201 [Ogataea polymorpha]KAG7905488.1 hypothetical protein KL907_002635 [Ogataea polymorpha]
MPKRFFDESNDANKSGEDTQSKCLTSIVQNSNEELYGSLSFCRSQVQYCETQESVEPQFFYYQNVCSVCHAILQNSHILELHLNELHSSFFKSRLEKVGMIFECFNSYCSELFSSVECREQHMINCHDYPQGFDFNGLLHGRHKE